MKKFLSLLLLADVALANTVETIKPIYITAEKIEITDGMVSHDSISKEEIKQNPNKNIADITKVLPNVERSGSLRGSNSEFKIRGMEDTRITTKIDGSKSNFRGEYKGRNFVSPFMLSGISVIRGSNSVMEGSGSIAGSVNLQTKEVEDIALNKNAKKGTELFSSYGTNGNMQNYGGATFVKNGGYSILGAYNFTKNNNFELAKETSDGTKKTKTIEYTENQTNNAMVKFKKEFNDYEFVKISTAIFEEKGENTSNPFRFASSFRGEPVNKDLKNQRTSAEIELERVNVKVFYDTTKITENRITDGRFDKTKASSYGINTFGKYKYKTEKLENILFYGVELIRDTQDGTRQEMSAKEDRKNLFPKGTTDTKGAYLQSATKFGNFKMMLGLRQDHYKMEANGYSKSHTSNLLKKAVFSYTINDVFTPFVRYSEGYRAPLIKEAFASGDIVDVRGFKLKLAPNPDLKPEYSRNYEVGFKFEREGLLQDYSNTSLNFTYFIQDVKDFIIQDPNCNIGNKACSSPNPTMFTFQYQNLNNVRFNGVEAELKYESSSYLVSFTGSTLKAEESNGNKILQTPVSKFVAKFVRKFENGISIGVESISASSVKSDKFRNYQGMITADNFKPSMPGIPPKVILGMAKDCKDLRLCEETKGYSLVNFNIDYTKKTEQFEGLIGVGLQNAFNVEYKEQTSYIPGMGRNVNFYARVKF